MTTVHVNPPAGVVATPIPVAARATIVYDLPGRLVEVTPVTSPYVTPRDTIQVTGLSARFNEVVFSLARGVSIGGGGSSGPPTPKVTVYLMKRTGATGVITIEARLQIFDATYGFMTFADEPSVYIGRVDSYAIQVDHVTNTNVSDLGGEIELG